MGTATFREKSGEAGRRLDTKQVDVLAKDGAFRSGRYLGGARWDSISDRHEEFKVRVYGEAGGIGPPLPLLKAMGPNVGDLRIFDLSVAMVPPAGVAQDLGHLERKCTVQGNVMEVGKNPINHVEECLAGCHLVLVPRGVPRKP